MARKRDSFRALDQQHAVYNFLHDYYHVKGAKGTRRLARWSAGPSALLVGASDDECAMRRYRPMRHAQCPAREWGAAVPPHVP